MQRKRKPPGRITHAESAVKPQPVKKKKGCGCGGYRKRKKSE
ncbi:hypothetical protein [Neobacillus notoginsengisoli]|nr:hypothetical protein [Neobacillus notoginsengisoli]